MDGQAPPPYVAQQQPQPGAYYPPPDAKSYPAPQPGYYPPPQPAAYPPPAGYPGQQPMYPQAPGQPGQPYYPPPQTGQQQQSTTVIMTQTVLAPMSYGFNPVQTTCPHCQATIQTAVEYEVGGYAWMICGIITAVAFLVFWPMLLGCCFIPFCINDCKDVIHICPNCRQTLAHVARR